jgi:hypothetical protein
MNGYIGISLFLLLGAGFSIGDYGLNPFAVSMIIVAGILGYLGFKK